METHAANFVNAMAGVIAIGAIGYVLFASVSRRGLTIRSWLAVLTVVAIAAAVKVQLGN